MPQTPRNQKTYYTLSNAKKHIAQTNNNTTRLTSVESDIYTVENTISAHIANTSIHMTIGGAEGDIQYNASSILAGSSNLNWNGTALQVTGGAGVPMMIAENTGAGANLIVNVTDGGAASLKAGTGQQQFKFDNGYAFAIASDTKANILVGTGSGTNRLTIHNTTGDVDILTGSLIMTVGNIAVASGTVSVQDDAYTDSWDANLTVPTKNAIYDVLSPGLKYHYYVNGVGLLNDGGLITSNGDGTIAVLEIVAALRITDTETGALSAYTIAAVASLALTDNQTNFIYAEYNGGSPQIVATTTERSYNHTNVLVASVLRNGITLHIDETAVDYIGDFHYHVIERFEQTERFRHASGAVISETGVLNFAITTGNFWRKLNPLILPAIDTSVADTFSYWYDDGAGGFTEVTAQTQIDNLQYDDGTGILATLTNNRYGIHWIYGETDGDIMVVYGDLNTNSLSTAQEALPPSNIPNSIVHHGILIGKIIIQKSAVVFADIQSAFMTPFSSSGITSHLDLADIGTNTHAQIDAHIADTTIHSPTIIKQMHIGRIYATSTTNWHVFSVAYGYSYYNNGGATTIDADTVPVVANPGIMVAEDDLKITRFRLTGRGYSPTTMEVILVKYNRNNSTNISTVMPVVSFLPVHNVADTYVDVEIGSGLNDVTISKDETLFFFWRAIVINKFLYDAILHVEYEKV